MSIMPIRTGGSGGNSNSYTDTQIKIMKNYVDDKMKEYLTKALSSTGSVIQASPDVIQINNMLYDHSFELIPEDTFDAAKQDYAIPASYLTNVVAYKNWEVYGDLSALRIMEAYNYYRAGGKIIFGDKMVAVKNSSYLYQRKGELIAGRKYTLSAFFAPHPFRCAAGAQVSARMIVDFFYGSGAYIGSASKDFLLTPNHTANKVDDMLRCSLTFDVPPPYGVGCYAVFNLMSTSDAAPVLVDGAQLTEGQYPNVYNPETMIWQYMLGKTTTPGGSSAGVVIDDTNPSTSKVYSSAKVEDIVDAIPLAKIVPDNPVIYDAAAQRREYGFYLPPAVIATNPVINLDSSKIVDGAKFSSVVHVEGMLPSPLDKFYAYVSGHDGQDIYLLTAPAPEGPFTFRQSVRNVAASPFSGHLSSPCALVHNNKIYVYYHGNNTDGTQPTALMTSSDGINFTSSAVFPVIKVHANKSSKFYGQSTSYANVMKYNGKFIAVFQGNSNLDNVQTTYATVTIACAVSDDGENFRVMRKPLIANKTLQRGYFCSAITRVFDKWLLLYQDMSDGRIKASISENLEYNSFQDLGIIIDKNTATWNAQKVEAPSFLFYNKKLYIYFGGWDAGGFGRVGVATIDLGV